MNFHAFCKPLILILLLAIGGCGSAPTLRTYSIPDKSLPSAKVKLIPNYVGRHDGGGVEREEFDCSDEGTVIASHNTSLAVFDQSTQKPVEVTLPSGDAHFNVAFSQGEFSCSLRFSAILEVNHTYTLSSFIVREGFFSTTKCESKLTDSATGMQVPVYLRNNNKVIGESVCKKFSQTAHPSF